VDTKSLREWLDQSRGFDGALMHKSVRVAVNSEIVDDPFPVSDADEIAFMPPVGGG
jgi:molybdopterin synthase sulfur carrier subunit